MIESGPAGSPDHDHPDGAAPDGHEVEGNALANNALANNALAGGEPESDRHPESNHRDADPEGREPDGNEAAVEPPPALSPEMPKTGADQLRLVEAVLFASSEPIETRSLAARLPFDADLSGILRQLSADYNRRGVRLEQSGDRWAFRTAPDLGRFLDMERAVARKLSRAAVETLAIIAYHQPATRADIEDIRGVALSKGTLDMLLQAGWLRPCGRRRTPGRPMTWGTTDGFLDHFGLAGLDDLPGVEELRQAGLLDSAPGMQALREQTDEPTGDDRQGDLLDHAAQAKMAKNQGSGAAGREEGHRPKPAGVPVGPSGDPGTEAPGRGDRPNET